MALGVREVVKCARVRGAQQENEQCFYVLVCGKCCGFANGVRTALEFSLWGAEMLMTKPCRRETPPRRRVEREALVWEAFRWPPDNLQPELPKFSPACCCGCGLARRCACMELRAGRAGFLSSCSCHIMYDYRDTVDFLQTV